MNVWFNTRRENGVGPVRLSSGGFCFEAERSLRNGAVACVGEHLSGTLRRRQEAFSWWNTSLLVARPGICCGRILQSREACFSLREVSSMLGYLAFCRNHRCKSRWTVEKRGNELCTPDWGNELCGTFAGFCLLQIPILLCDLVTGSIERLLCSTSWLRGVMNSGRGYCRRLAPSKFSECFLHVFVVALGAASGHLSTTPTRTLNTRLQ